MSAKKAESLWRNAATPVLLLLTGINLLNYLDRYILAALAPAIQKELHLDDAQIGFLATAFMFSYFLVSPIFGRLGDTKPRFKLMAVGVALWSVATGLSGLAKNYWALLAARFSIGVGEAAYGAISPSVLTDLYPKSLRGRAFAIFFMAIPVGSALGYLLGGFLEGIVGWRWAFVVAGLPGLFLALSLLFFREPNRGAMDDEALFEKVLPMKEVIGVLRKNSTYMLTIWGYCAYTFVVGGVAFWIPSYIERYLGVTASKGSMAFGALTVVAGFLGTILGGAWADRWARRSNDAYLKLSALSMLAALPIFWWAISVSGFWQFCVLVFFLEFFLFLSTSPVNAQIVNCVSPSMRATANAMGIFLIHLLGDAISPSLVGIISKQTNLHMGMSIFVVGIAVSTAIWAWKVIVHWECMPWPTGALTLPTEQCHRGLYGANVQENTLEAFRSAAQAGAKMVELDVRLSRDGIPVVVHDPDTKRVSGKMLIVKDTDAEILFREANVPSLEKVLKDSACLNLLINVELKSDRARSDGLEAAVAKVIHLLGAEKRVIFSSFNPLALRRLSKLLPEVPRALLANSKKEPQNKIYLRKMWLACLARPHMLNIDQDSVNELSAADWKGRGVPFAVWTVEDHDKARKFLALGAKSIISPKVKIL
jgi:MFS family permease/glycerophosphoryl diester phosphodiesterase